MKFKIFTMFDGAAMTYSKPFFEVNENVARRQLQVLVNSGDNAVAKNPTDFTLFFIGEFDDEKAELLPAVSPLRICGAHELVQQVSLFDCAGQGDMVGQQEKKAKDRSS